MPLPHRDLLQGVKQEARDGDAVGPVDVYGAPPRRKKTRAAYPPTTPILP